MPYTFYTTYTCKCGAKYKSTHYKEPDGCPDCRKTHHKHRDKAYDGVLLGAPPSVYTSTCVIHIRREYALCKGVCGQVRDLINGYCDVCRGNGVNEPQCDNATMIR